MLTQTTCERLTEMPLVKKRVPDRNAGCPSGEHRTWEDQTLTTPTHDLSHTRKKGYHDLRSLGRAEDFNRPKPDISPPIPSWSSQVLAPRPPPKDEKYLDVNAPQKEEKPQEAKDKPPKKEQKSHTTDDKANDFFNNLSSIPEGETAAPKTNPYLEAARRKVLEEHRKASGQREKRNSWGKRLPDDYQSRRVHKAKVRGFMNSQARPSTTYLTSETTHSEASLRKTSLDDSVFRETIPDSTSAELVNMLSKDSDVNHPKSEERIIKLTFEDRPRTSPEDIISESHDESVSKHPWTSQFPSNATISKKLSIEDMMFSRGRKKSRAGETSTPGKSEPAAKACRFKGNTRSLPKEAQMLGVELSDIPKLNHPTILRPSPRRLWPHKGSPNPLASNPCTPSAKKHGLPSISISQHVRKSSAVSTNIRNDVKAQNSPPLSAQPPRSPLSPTSFHTPKSRGTPTSSIHSHQSPSRIPPNLPTSPKSRAMLADLSSSSSSSSLSHSSTKPRRILTASPRDSLLNQNISPAPAPLDIPWMNARDSQLPTLDEATLGRLCSERKEMNDRNDMNDRNVLKYMNNMDNINEINDMTEMLEETGRLDMPILDISVGNFMHEKGNRAQRRRDTVGGRRRDRSSDNEVGTSESRAPMGFIANSKTSPNILERALPDLPPETVYDAAVVAKAERDSPEIMKDPPSRGSSSSSPTRIAEPTPRRAPPTSKFNSPRTASPLSRSSSPLHLPTSKFNSPHTRSPLSGTSSPRSVRSNDDADDKLDPAPLVEIFRSGNVISRDIGWKEGVVEGYGKGFREGFAEGVAEMVKGKMVQRSEVRVVEVEKGRSGGEGREGGK
ncbi:hypothetical protein GLAREA_12706 [Glarea lozoyensis ATCC 20868]|uniref:Uncharacterized protein n=1 Tax=Glarea lozoyensis (strain ATCC 20868 / MF5171) TaxID=1116229 RepID=S3DYH3_GLAL2|nr:uncharacterized protein GLAREA_12706 [Glarea lozoyensis ATCC 20868]EPE31403.1 hypothetical protein GLAREA_12706 [Glarea lozoyensis ATCC 20868]